jgi:hypothetical protein
VNLCRRRLPVADSRNDEIELLIEFIHQMPGDLVVGRAARAIAVQNNQMMEALLDQRGANFKDHGLISRNRQRDGAGKELERLRDAVRYRWRNHRVDPVRQFERNIFGLMRIGVGRHVWAVRLRRSGRQYDRLALADDLGDFHLRHTRHPTFHDHPFAFEIADQIEFSSGRYRESPI